MSFNIGLSGIRAASTDLEVTGNNVANASTTGFKESRAEFGDVYTSTLLGTGSKPVGSGVMVENVRQEFSQGNISGTDNALDLAIDGNGFFVLNGGGSVSYTRSGIFSLDKEGFVTANNGGRLQGYESNDQGVVNGVLSDIQIQVANQSPQLTNRISSLLNLNSGESVIQEQGLQLIANGLSIATPVSGIIESTATTLSTESQPTTAGVPARMNWNMPFNTNDLATVAANGTVIPLSISFDIDGTGFQEVTLPIQPAGQTEQQLLSSIQTAVNTTLGSQQLLVTSTTGSAPGGFLQFQRDGYAATNGSSFQVQSPTNFDEVFNSSNMTSGIIPAAAATSTTVSAPPLNITTANNIFTMSVNTTPTSAINRPITITPGVYANTAALAAEIQTQINADGGATGLAGKVTVAAVGNQLQFTTANTGATESIAFSATPVAGGGASLTALGLATAVNVAGADAINTALYTGNSGIVAGTPSTKLFVGSPPQIADFRSIDGTSTTTRSTGTPPLTMVSALPGEAAVLSADNVVGAQDLSTVTGNRLAFTIATEAGNTYAINLSEAGWNTTAGPQNPAGVLPAGGFDDGGLPTANPVAVPVSEIIAQINAQIAATAPGQDITNADVIAVDNGGRIELQMQVPPANNGESITIADNAGALTSIGLNLNNLGFLPANRFDPGVEPVLANNFFTLQVNSTSGNASSARDIVIPAKNYASLNDVAAAIQEIIDTDIGASGLAGKVTVTAVGGQLVFTNENVGSGETLAFTPTGGTPATAAAQASFEALGFDSLFTVTGQDSIDKQNSFRINLTVPAPDLENRSGSVLISLDEEYRSVQQLAASINRQLNSQGADDFIGVRAEAAEIEPKVVPPEYQLRLVATQEGESSIISVSDIAAVGEDISTADVFGLLQLNPDNAGLLMTGEEGVNNNYPEQKVTLTNPKGEETVVEIKERTEANEIASIFNKQPGLTASAETVMTIPANSYNNQSGTMTMTVNGQALTKTSLADIVDEINSFRGTTLPGFKAALDEAGGLVITNEIGRDVKVEIESSSNDDSLVVTGGANTGPVVLGGSATAERAAAVGGSVTFILNEGYTMSSPEPVISGLFGALSEDEFTPYTLNVFDPTDQNTFNHSTSTTIFDSLGNAHVMTQYFVKEPLDPTRPNEQNIWAMYVTVNGEDVGDPDATLPFPENLEATRSRTELYFNQDGSFDSQATGDIYITNWDPKDKDGDATGAYTSLNVLEGGLPLSDPGTNSNFQVILDGSTQFGSAFSVSEVSQNGYTTGRLTGLEVNEEGIIFARYTNGQAQTLGQVALANFRNPEGLTPLGDTGWAESFESGVPTVGSARTGSFGSIRSSALEDSNVDLSEELVGLIIAQRNFQASAKTIEAADQVTQTILNI